MKDLVFFQKLFLQKLEILPNHIEKYTSYMKTSEITQVIPKSDIFIKAVNFNNFKDNRGRMKRNRQIDHHKIYQVKCQILIYNH